MSKKLFLGVGAILVLGVAAIAAYVLRPSQEASAPIAAVPVEVITSESEIEAESQEDSGPGRTEGEDSDAMSSESLLPEDKGHESIVIFTILQDQSEVRFTLDEILNGNPKTVIGVSNQVSGEIAIDVDNPANSQVGMILINARTLKTDNDFRNRAINNQILETGKYEFIRFNPTLISGFPENPQIGEGLKFQITGDLTIRDITLEITFDAKVTVNSETQLSGYASTVIAIMDYDIRIPEVPMVADVDEEVLLEIEFLAERNE